MADWLAPSLSLLGGFVALVAGGEFLVRGASALAAAVRISPLVIGLTVVAFGTSSPELAVSLKAALSGQGDLSLGNVVGSNICNVLLILGLSAAVAPLLVSSRLVRFDVPVMIGVSVAVLLLGLDGEIGRADGLLLVAGVVVYTGWLILQSRRESGAVREEFAERMAEEAPSGGRPVLRQVGWIVLGLALLTGGSHVLVGGATDIARLLGVGELVVGLTIVAVGTSLPELVTSVVASIRGQRDIAVGNVVGSNLFNLLAVLGIAAAASPGGVRIPHAALAFDLPVMIGVAVACLPVFFTGGRIARSEGVLFLSGYVFYTTYLVLAAVGSPHSRTLGSAILFLILPLTVLTLGAAVTRELRRRRAG